MKTRLAVLSLVGLLVALPAAAAKKTIIISDSLTANAKQLAVDEGDRSPGQVHQWRFGEYAVVSRKMGWTITRTNGNSDGIQVNNLHVHSEKESATTTKFSFVLTNATADSATVNAEHVVSTRSPGNWQLDLGHGSSVGSGGEEEQSDRFAAFITINSDTTESWALYIHCAEGGGETVLTNGERRVVLSYASSNKSRPNTRTWSAFSPPAEGYEFIENGQTLCALQYFVGSFGVHDYSVWIHGRPDARTRLVLAAAMTAVMQSLSL